MYGTEIKFVGRFNVCVCVCVRLPETHTVQVALLSQIGRAMHGFCQ